MSKNTLHRAYDRLTPEERFRLDVLATARGDLEDRVHFDGDAAQLPRVVEGGHEFAQVLVCHGSGRV